MLDKIARSVRAFTHELKRTPAAHELSRPKIGIALGGGFARGLAHIGIRVHDLARSTLVLVGAEGVEERNGHRLDPGVSELTGDRRDVALVELAGDAAVG